MFSIVYILFTSNTDYLLFDDLILSKNLFYTFYQLIMECASFWFRHKPRMIHKQTINIFLADYANISKMPPQYDLNI